MIESTIDSNLLSYSYIDGQVQKKPNELHYLTHWGRMTHICVSKLTKPLSEPMLEYC